MTRCLEHENRDKKFHELFTARFSLTATATMVGSCGSSPDASDTLDASKDFVALDPSADAWDDTALISAFDRAVASYKRPGEKRKRRVEHPTEVADADIAPPRPLLPFPPPSRPPQQAHTKQRIDTTTAKDTSESMMLPPPPPPPPAGTDRTLRDLLSAWYEAGFRAGVYSAAQDKKG